MIVLVDYASPSVLDSTREATTVGLATNLRRRVRFYGRVREHGFVLRIALRALGEVIWSNDLWFGQSDLLDPVITVHRDRICFEAFSQDQSAYVSLIIDPSLFETMGEVVSGTTNIDFTAWLWGALGEMRTSRSTIFRIGPEGFDVRTSSAGGRFEKKVELPENWVRGFLQVQAAMGMPGTRLSVKPIDLLSAVRFLRYAKAKVSPRAVRYEFEPGQDARLVLEPWERVIALEGAQHNYSEFKSTRVWGRRRLKLIEGLLPFADGVDIYLKGRALPSFYAVKLPGMTFLLGLTGWSGSGFMGTGALIFWPRLPPPTRARSSLPLSSCVPDSMPPSGKWPPSSASTYPKPSACSCGCVGRDGRCSTSRPSTTGTASCLRPPPTRPPIFPRIAVANWPQPFSPRARCAS